MSTLHIVSKSPFRTDALSRCLSLVSAGDAILLIEDAVGAVHLPELSADEGAINNGVACYALDADLAARGLAITQAEAGIMSVDYAGFVDLVCRHKNSVTYA